MSELSSAAVKCKVCGYEKNVVDLDPREGWYFTSIKWGPNMLAPASRTDEDMIDGYVIYLIDSCKRKRVKVGQVPKSAIEKPSDVNTCCYSDAYSVSFSGELPVDQNQFMIVPYKGKYELPHGSITSALADLVTGVAEIVDLTLKMSVRNSVAFMDDYRVRTGLAKVTANSIPTVDASQVKTVSLTADRSRRLSAVWRALRQRSSVDAILEIILPEHQSRLLAMTGTQVATMLESSIAAVQANIQKQILGYDVIVTDIEAFTKTIGSTTAPTVKPPTAGTCPCASFALLTAACASVFALGTQQLE